MNCPQSPISPTPELREAQKPDDVPSSTLTWLSTWKKALRFPPRFSVPRKPMFELLLVTRPRLLKSCPGFAAPVASTLSTSTLMVP
jgi:hypothetical protein